MPQARDYRLGDPVESPAGMCGTVSGLGDGSVSVTYKDRRDVWVVTYSPDWFRRWGEYLKKLAR